MIKSILNTQQLVTLSAPGTYAAGAHNILTIVNGPVWIRAIIERNVTAMAGATTTTIAVGGVNMCVGAVAIGAAAINTMVVSPLDAAVAKIAPALTVQMPSLLGYATNVGVVAAAGNITVTFSGVAMGAAEQYQLIVVYQPLAPNARVI